MIELTANTSQYSLQPGVSTSLPVEQRIRIDPELKAGGTINREFKVSVTPEGLKVDVTV